MKATLSQLVPDVLVGALQRFRPKARTYASYAEAMADCSTAGYENDAIVNTVVEKNRRYREQLAASPVLELGSLRTLIGLGLARRGSQVAVLDFGGGGGSHYTVANLISSATDRLRWNVVETPAMARAARVLARDGLKFFDDVGAAAKDLGDVDLVFASSSINYTTEPLQTLRVLAEVGAKYLHITRTPLSVDHERVIVKQISRLAHHGPGPLPPGVADREVSCPDTAVNKAAFEAVLSRDYTIRVATIEDRDVHRTALESIHYYGYLCERRA